MLSKAEIQEVERVRKLLAEHLSKNVALFDCEGSCPDEVALNEDLLTDEYCNWCFAGQILNRIGSIPSKDQSLPEKPYMSALEYGEDTIFNFLWGAGVAQREMGNKHNFKRCINIEEYEKEMR